MSLSEIIKAIIPNVPTTVPKPKTPFPEVLNKALEKDRSQSKKRGKSRRK